MELTNEQIQSLAKFALGVLEDWPDMGSLDGGDLQEIAVANNILVPHIVHGPCCDNCFCSEFYGNEEWRDGVTCYRIADWLGRAAELPLERNGGDGVCWTCPNCGEKNNVEVPACTKCYYTPS